MVCRIETDFLSVAVLETERELYTTSYDRGGKHALSCSIPP